MTSSRGFCAHAPAAVLPAESARDETLSRFDCLSAWTQRGQVRVVRKG